MRLALLLASACLFLGCSRDAPVVMATTNDTIDPGPPVTVLPVDPVGIRPIPPIPAAMRGCWDAPAPDDPEEPGAAFRLVIEATTITQTFAGSKPLVARAEFVERVTPTRIEGRFSAPGESSPMTVATSLELGPDDNLGLAAGDLRLQEGDAGSAVLQRCRG